MDRTLSPKIDYQQVLNPAQIQAVMTTEGPLLVIAGAGSGKTRTLIYRVAHLVEIGTVPQKILLLTFTRKASGEMLERAAGLADERCRMVSGGTFHSLAHRVLRQEAPKLGYDKDFTVLDRSDMEEIVQALAQDMQVERGAIRFPKRATLASILSKAANLQQPLDDLVQVEYSQFGEYIHQIVKLSQSYRIYKKEHQLMDYDDLILLFRQLLAENESVRRSLHAQYQYIMVDEYQDTNGIQAEIVKWLTGPQRNVMVVGDDSQSIYSFRGANYRNMFDFPKLFPGCQIIKLEENYRSTQPILTLTNSLMDQAREKYTKCLFTRRSDGEKPKVVNTRTEPEQALFVCRTIKGRLGNNRSLKDFAVLFRAAHHSFELELELTRQGIPFVKYGGFKFMESAHIKDLLSHLRVMVNKEDSLSWGRMLRLIQHIGQAKSQRILEWMKTQGRLPAQVGDCPDVGKGQEGLKRLGHFLAQLSVDNLTPKKAVELALEYYRPILKEQFDDFPKREKDLEQLLPMASRYRKLRPFLDDLVLEPPTSSADMTQPDRKECLTLSTVHSAKGLEWSDVFIIWAMDGYFPSAKAGANQEAVEEERRLMYVAATRAKDRLLILYPGLESPRWWTGYQDNGNGNPGGLCSMIQSLPGQVFEHFSPGLAFQAPPHHWEEPSPTPFFEKPKTGHRQAPAESPPGLRPGERVRHPAFGQGVVSKILEKEKIEVLFRDAGRKVLHLGYTTLEKI
jgi:DNA helicase-2/ATP-dependent DNA helicase PcrA